MKRSIVFLFVSVFFVFGASFHRSYAGEEQERAFKAIRKAGGTVTPLIGSEPRVYVYLYCDDETDLAAVLKEIRHLPDLQQIKLSKNATEDHLMALAVLPHVYTLDLRGSKVTDAGIRFVVMHKGLMDLHIDDTKVGDAGLKEITHLEHLRRLNMRNTPVTDQGMQQLIRLRTLDELTVGAGISDEGLKEIGKMTWLKALRVAGDDITGKGLKELAPLKNLVQLSVISKKLVDHDLKELATFPNLSSVSLTCPQITDKGLAHLAELNLAGAYLRGTLITDTGILQLVGISRLRQLDVRDTKVTDDGRKRFRQIRPNVTFLE